jgi:hypothetical protein
MSGMHIFSGRGLFALSDEGVLEAIWTLVVRFGLLYVVVLLLLSMEASDTVLFHIERLLGVVRLLLNESNHGLVTLRVKLIVVSICEI